MAVIPAIAFDSGINTDWHTLKKDFGQVLLLAGPGIVVIAILVAIFFKYPMGYDGLTWGEALLIGAIFSATDPVAVIAMLKEVGASNKISVIIDGESLLNDGTAMVFYHVMAEIVKSGTLNIGDIIGLFVRLTLGAWTIGFLFALGMYFWFRRLTNDAVEATGLTLSAAYLLFLVCEGTQVEMSGILAICSMGYFLSGFSGNVISPLVEEPLHHIWSFIGWVAETFLFVLVGVIIGGSILPTDQIDGKDWPLLLLFFVLLYLSRVIMLGLFYPILKYSGYSITWRSFIVFVHAGLRGGVALALSLSVWTDTEYSNLLRSKVVFHAAGMAFMTVILNGCTGKLLIKTLGLSDNSGEQELAINDATKSIISSGDQVMAKIVQSAHLAQVDWTKVVNYTGTRKMAEEVVARLTAGISVKNRMKKEGHQETELLQEYEDHLAHVDRSKRLAEARARFLLVLKSRYHYYHSHGLCLPPSFVYLIHQNDIANDFTDTKLRTWEVVEPTVLHSIITKALLCLRNMPLFKKYLHRLIYQRIGEAYDCCLAFYTAHEEAWKLFSEALPGLTSDVVEDLREEVRAQVSGCKSFIARHLLDGYRLLAAAFQEKTAAVLILSKIAETISEQNETGIITSQEAAMISQSVEGRLWNLFYANPVKYVPDVLECIHIWPLLKDAPTAFFTELIAKSSMVLMLDKEYLFKDNQTLEFVYLLVHGRVNERNEEGTEFEHEPGSLIGAQYVLNKQTTVATTARADMWVFARRIPVASLQELLTSYEKDVWKAAYPVLIMFSQSAGKVTPDMSSKALVRMVSSSTISVNNPGEIVHMPFGGVAVPQLQTIDEEAEHVPRSRQLSNGIVVFDPEHSDGVHMRERAAVIQFNPGLYELWQNSGRDMNRVLRGFSGDPDEKGDIGRRATGLSGRGQDSDDEFSPSK